MTTATEGCKGSGKTQYSLVDCEEGLVRDRFRYPEYDATDASDTSDNSLSQDKLELFRWQMADETEFNSNKPEKIELHKQEIVNTQKAIESSFQIKPDNNLLHRYDLNQSPGSSTDTPATSSTTVMSQSPSPASSKPSSTPSTSKGLPGLKIKKLKQIFQQSYTVENDGEKNSNGKKKEIKIKSKSRRAAASAMVQSKSGTGHESGTDVEYPHLSAQESELLRKGTECYKNKEYQMALTFYREGHCLNPNAKEFQYSIFLCEKKVSHKSEKKKTKIKDVPMTSTSICWSGSEQESREMCLSRHSHLLQQAEQAYGLSDFQACYSYCEKGLQILPNSKEFQKLKNKANDGILVTLGIKTVPDDFDYKQIVTKLLKAQQYIHDKDYDKGVEQCKHILHCINSLPSHVLSTQRLTLMASAFNLMGSGHWSLNQHKKALTCHLQQLDIAIKSDDNGLKYRALNQVAQVYVRLKQYEKAIIVWKQICELGIDVVEERAWLHHEMGHCYLELQDYQNAQKCAELSLAAAYTSSQGDRKLNAALLAAHATLRSGLAHESKIAFGRALYFAIEQGDTDAKASIESAIREIEAVMKEELE